ncbi:C4-dicarboxylate ABC transporter substrate-binding protein [Actinomycetospora sp. NBRC 106375]|uniref:TAXI family TRAP transporter solute-binding subunit n=1 Tax=Actinomycetospora sp. NBRC 106375 TaxID=3032207 RepID=UPI0024A2F42F|nr:TAXI family TRAP transporter solute-binding subunit [Actinomycetospora sp. NBRC 106375]GLZ45191.1 C4-dicarboxylate ABC transporter substrate-binding protein [Actinomycetospora sp. NBRC 106375]
MSPIPRRTVLRGTAAALAMGVGAGVAACARPGDRIPVALATGGPQGVYRRVGDALAGLWAAELGLDTRVVGSEGSVDNVGMLVSGQAQVAFCAADVAVDGAVDGARPRFGLRALARVHDDAIQVVVPAESPVRTLADLAGRRVSVGARNSGVLVIAPRLLTTVGLNPARDMTAVMLGLGESVAALERGEIDAFFWSGGVPTAGVERLVGARPVRLLDLAAPTAVLRARYPVYDLTTVPARTYGLPDPVTVTSVRNVLLVTADMPDARAEALTRVLLEGRERLSAADAAGRAIDPRTAIGTQPVPLHPGAVAAYRGLKGL